MNESIYSHADPQLLKLFAAAGNPRKVLCIPLDFAKSSHAVLFCNGLGDVLKKPFYIPNSAEGLEELLAHVQSTCKHRAIDKKHVVFGGEDTPLYAANFTARLRQKGFLVARVNAAQAKKQRQNQHASTDLLDLVGIAHCLLTSRAQVLSAKPDLQARLRLLVRERDYLVRTRTALVLRVHGHVDRLFPGFLQSSASGITAFSSACWWLLSSRFSAPSIGRRDEAKLAAALKEHRVHEPLETARQLQELARNALAPETELVPESQLALEQMAKICQTVEKALETLDQEIALLLAQTPGAMLTTVPGIGITLAAGLSSELALLKEIPSLARFCAYAGIVPQSEQSGGADQNKAKQAASWGGNKHLKNYLLQAGERMADVSQSDAARFRIEAQANKRHVLRVLGKHAAKVVRSVLLHQSAYLPARLHAANSSPQERAGYYLQMWPHFLQKWRARVPYRKLFAEGTALGQWRAMVQQAYAISLPLPGGEQNDVASEDNQPQR